MYTPRILATPKQDHRNSLSGEHISSRIHTKLCDSSPRALHVRGLSTWEIPGYPLIQSEGESEISTFDSTLLYNTTHQYTKYYKSHQDHSIQHHHGIPQLFCRDLACRSDYCPPSVPRGPGQGGPPSGRHSRAGGRERQVCSHQ